MSKKLIKVKILPPLTPDMKSIETTVELSDNAKLIDLLKIISEEKLLNTDIVFDEYGKLRESIVILVDGDMVSDPSQDIKDANKIVIMPLAPGG